MGRSRADANRLNAAKSTGPRSPEGKRSSSRNALKHGLSRLHIGPDRIAAAIVQLRGHFDVAADFGDGDLALGQVAASQIELTRIRTVVLSVIERAQAGDVAGLETLPVLQEYERRCLSRRKKALRQLDEVLVRATAMRTSGAASSKPMGHNQRDEVV